MIRISGSAKEVNRLLFILAHHFKGLNAQEVMKVIWEEDKLN